MYHIWVHLLALTLLAHLRRQNLTFKVDPRSERVNGELILWIDQSCMCLRWSFLSIVKKLQYKSLILHRKLTLSSDNPWNRDTVVTSNDDSNRWRVNSQFISYTDTLTHWQVNSMSSLMTLLCLIRRHCHSNVKSDDTDSHVKSTFTGGATLWCNLYV